MSKKSEFVGLRIERELLREIDRVAKREGITRSAVILRAMRRERAGGVRLVGNLSWLMSRQLVVRCSVGDPVVELMIAAPEHGELSLISAGALELEDEMRKAESGDSENE